MFGFWGRLALPWGGESSGESHERGDEEDESLGLHLEFGV